MNFLTIRQGWAKARIKATAERKASSTPGRLSSIPTTAEAAAETTHNTRKTRDLFLFPGVENASRAFILFHSSLATPAQVDFS